MVNCSGPYVFSKLEMLLIFLEKFLLFLKNKKAGFLRILFWNISVMKKLDIQYNSSNSSVALLNNYA